MTRLLWKRLGLGAAVLTLGGIAALWGLSSPRALHADRMAEITAMDADSAAGERVFWAAGCAGCHAAPGIAMNAPAEERLILSGGRRLNSDFGTFVAPNVSMHAEYGIGGWTLEEFAQATLAGVSPRGTHYYPAFPYTSYSRMTAQDVADLWAFWQTLPADATPSEPHALRFPFTIRRALGLWNRLHLTDAFATAEPDDPDALRGRYLSEALAHCAECHTPRNAMGALDTARWLDGAPNPSGSGRIPAIPGDWTAAQVTAYLQSGITPAFDFVGGSMADVVAHMQQLPDTDRQAIAAYLIWLRDG